jgi:shikimate kinase|tara:strand:- start:3210 stop:3713 length:504 start_codon:yes stop_codon:yes gene_type:complete
MKKNLVLIGMMGSGKSTIARLLSDKTKLNLIDTDKLIEKETNLKIEDIFEKKGEFFFRKIEEKITLESLKSSNNIIAVGGGTFLNDKIRKQITNNCISIWLNWSEQILIPRIKNSKKRPKAYLLKDKDLKKLINDRSKIYSKADYKINCDSLGKNEIISKILKIYEK